MFEFNRKWNFIIKLFKINYILEFPEVFRWLILKTYQDPNKLGLLFFLSDCAHLNVTKTAMVTYEAYNLKYMEYFTQATTATKYCYEGLFT